MGFELKRIPWRSLSMLIIVCLQKGHRLGEAATGLRTLQSSAHGRAGFGSCGAKVGLRAGGEERGHNLRVVNGPVQR